MISKPTAVTKAKIRQHKTFYNLMTTHIYYKITNEFKDSAFANNIVDSLLKFLKRYSRPQEKQKKNDPHYEHMSQYLEKYSKDSLQFKLLYNFSQYVYKIQKKIKHSSIGLSQLANLIFNISLKIAQTQSNKWQSSSHLLKLAMQKSTQEIFDWMSYRKQYKEDGKDEIYKTRIDIVKSFFYQVFSPEVKIEEMHQEQDKINIIVKTFLNHFFKINFFLEVNSKIQKKVFKNVSKFNSQVIQYKKKLCQWCNDFWNQFKDKQDQYQFQVLQEDFKNIIWRCNLMQLNQNQKEFVQIPYQKEVLQILGKYLSNKVEQKTFEYIQFIEIALEIVTSIYKKAIDNNNKKQSSQIYESIKKKLLKNKRIIALKQELNSAIIKSQLKINQQQKFVQFKQNWMNRKINLHQDIEKNQKSYSQKISIQQIDNQSLKNSQFDQNSKMDEEINLHWHQQEYQNQLFPSEATLQKKGNQYTNNPECDQSSEMKVLKNLHQSAESTQVFDIERISIQKKVYFQLKNFEFNSNLNLLINNTSNFRMKSYQQIQVQDQRKIEKLDLFDQLSCQKDNPESFFNKQNNLFSTHNSTIYQLQLTYETIKELYSNNQTGIDMRNYNKLL